MIYCKELNTSYDTKDELFKALQDNKELIISEKASKTYKASEDGKNTIKANNINLSKLKSINKSIDFEDDSYYFVVNSSNILDSHYDVHISGNWEKTKKEQKGKVYLVFDHTLKRSEIIAMKDDIELITADIPFSMLGKSYEGNAYCLIYKVKKDKIVNKEAKDWLEKGYSFEASVRMSYVKILSCFNSNRIEDTKEKENYEKYYPLIANKEDFKTIDYFWAVLEAKNVQESSLVMFGSNSATGMIQENKNNEPSKDTQHENKEAVSNTSDLLKLYNNIKF